MNGLLTINPKTAALAHSTSTEPEKKKKRKFRHYLAEGVLWGGAGAGIITAGVVAYDKLSAK